MDSVERLLRVLSLLQARPTWSARELADRLSVDPRTVRRDIARLRSLGYPVEATQGVPGYRLGAGGRLPPLLLDDDEAVAIAVGVRLAAVAAIHGLEAACVAALTKLDQVLPARSRERVRSVQDSMVHLDNPLRHTVDLDTLTLLAHACREAERVQFDYRGFQGKPTTRRVEPSQIVHTRNRWYLVGFDLDRDDWRTFRLDRITNAAATGHRFHHVAAPDATQRVADALDFSAPELEAEAVVPLAAAAASRALASDVAIIEPLDDTRSLVRISGPTVDHLARRILALPVQVEVVNPTEVRQRVRELATNLARLHR